MPAIKTDKQLIAQSFSRSALRYDAAANIQHQAGEALLSMLSEYGVDERQTIADIGCGTGYFSRQLVQQFGPQQLIGVDIAQGMLAVAARQNCQLDNVLWLCDDAESLSLADASVDIIFANFSLQWCEDLSRLFRGFFRVLRPGGVCCFNSLGPQTLEQLRSAWSEVDPLNHVNRFTPAPVWREAMVAQSFVILDAQCAVMTEYFDDARDALQSLKTIGANIVRGEHRQSLTGKQRFARFIEAYEAYRQPRGLPMSYQVNQWLIQKQG